MSNFYTEVLRRDKRLTSAARVADPLLLEPIFRLLVEKIIDEASERGEEFMLYETFRSKTRQKALFARGVSKRNRVGVHHFGLAADLVRVARDKHGRPVPSWQGDFDIIGELAHARGLVWGPDLGLSEKVHIQRCAKVDQAALFAEKWYPDEEYVAWRPGDKAGRTPAADIAW